MEFIDTHSHLYLEDFDADRDQIVLNAINAGVRKIVLPNIDSATVSHVLTLSHKFPANCFPALGLHPTSVKENYKDELSQIEKHLETTPCIAIGETGIDLYWDKTFFAQQCDAFSVQLDWARKLKIPIIIHCRESFNEIISILEKKAGPGLTGIFHSFSGTKEQAGKIIELGFQLGINGVVTFKNSKLPAELKEISLQNIVLETDSPFLTPAPFRGKRNESLYLIYIAHKIAEIKNLTIEEVSAITTQNANNIFNFNYRSITI